MDIARYPGIETGYNDASVARFKQEQGRSDLPANGDAVWCDWRRSQVTQFVRTAYERATAIKPQLKISAAVFAKRADATGRCLQDWEGWVNAGIVDFVVPMVFFSDSRVFRSTLDDLASLHSNRIYLGQGGYKMTAAEGVNQVTLARAAGFTGIVVYSYAQCRVPRRNDTTNLMEALKDGLFSQPDTVPVLSWK